jgi:hypothetical protein
MIAQLIEVLNTAAQTLPVDTRHGWAQIVAGQPAVHTGAGQWVPVAEDTSGTWSYVRMNGQARVEPIDIGEPCSGVRVRLPFRLVALLDRSACDELPGLLVQTAGSIRMAKRQFAQASGAYRVGFSSILWQVDDFATQEFQPLPNIPTDRVLVAIDVIMEVDGSEECFQGCGELTDVVCAIIAKASNAKVVECLGPDRVAQICDIPPPVCPPTTVNGEESETPTITVLQGGNPVGTLDPVTGVVTIEECEPGCEEPFTIKWQVGETIIDIEVYPDPCGGEAVLTCDTLIDAVVVEGAGTEEFGGFQVNGLWLPFDILGVTVYAPPGEVGTSEDSAIRREDFLAPSGPWQLALAGEVLYQSTTVESTPFGQTWEAVEGDEPPPTVRQATLGDLCCNNGAPCGPSTVKINGVEFAELGCDEEVDIPCDHITNGLVVEDCGCVVAQGRYIPWTDPIDTSGIGIAAQVPGSPVWMNLTENRVIYANLEPSPGLFLWTLNPISSGVVAGPNFYETNGGPATATPYDADAEWTVIDGPGDPPVVVGICPCPPPEPCPDLCDLLGEATDMEALATDLENCLPEGKFDELKDEICEPCPPPEPCPDLCELLGDVEPQNVEEEVYDCLTEAAQNALQSAICTGGGCDRAITATWGAYNDETTPVVLPAEYQGLTYDFVSDVGTNGTITVSVNGGTSFAAPPFTVGTAAVIFKRTTFSAAGSALYEE